MGSTIAAVPTHRHSKADGERFAGEQILEVVECATCGILYAIPEALVRSALKWRGDRPDGKGWKLCCPLGHTWWYAGKNDLEVAREALRVERDRAGRLAHRLEQTAASRTAYKAAATRARNEKARLIVRVANGVCPCCNRTFAQLARHMVAKHPEFVDEASS